MTAGEKLTSLELIEGRHSELVASIQKMSAKATVIRLRDHIRNLADLDTHPQAFFYHVDGVRRLCRLILQPNPISCHPALLRDLLALAETTAASPVASRVPDLAKARDRLALLLTAELAIRSEWENAAAILPNGLGAQVAALQQGDMKSLVSILSDADAWADLQMPLHLNDPEILEDSGAILTVLVDGPSIPDEYREAYLAELSANVTVQKQRELGECVVRARDSRGEELALGDDLKGLVREALDRAIMLLGPTIQIRAQRIGFEIEISLKQPAEVTDIYGRSILLPLTLAIARQIGEQLNLPAVLRPSASVIWTGDLDKHGAVQSVEGLTEKVDRIANSRTVGFAYPSSDHAEVDRLIDDLERPVSIERHPLTHVQDATANRQICKIETRSLLVRSTESIRRKTKPLGLVGTAIITLFLIALAFSIPRLASWLDTAIHSAHVTPDREHIELFNSRGRRLNRFRIPWTEHRNVILADIDQDGIPEVLFGTSKLDSVPGTLFCWNSEGTELWRFQGGFREGEQQPYDLPNSFNAGPSYVRDLDNDGKNEIIVVFTHSPYFVGQVALLDAEGTHISSFWHSGYLAPSPSGGISTAVDFADIDQDGFREVLIGGINNSWNRACLVVLDPRNLSGKGPERGDTASIHECQSYVLFPPHAEIQSAMGVPNFFISDVEVRKWEDRQVIAVRVHGRIPQRGPDFFLRYFIDFDLNVVDWYMTSVFSDWAMNERKAGRLQVDITSDEFEGKMRRIMAIPGPSELLLP